MIIVWTMEDEGKEMYSRKDFDDISEFQEHIRLGLHQPGLVMIITKELEIELIADNDDGVLISTPKENK